MKSFISKVFDRKKAPAGPPQARGLLIFSNTSEVIKAEDVLKTAGYQIRVMSPPPQYRTGCDLAIDFPLVEQLGVRRCLKEKRINPLEMLPLSEERLEPLKLCRVTDFGDYLMIKAANMKITIHKVTKKIVNISGGGCPDVPYLASEMIGHRLSEAPSPRKLGYTLCAYSLNVAYEEALKIMEEQLC